MPATFVAALALDSIPEQLPLLRDAGQLPDPGPERQQVLLHAVAAEAAKRPSGSPVIFDAGPVSILAFTRFAFGAEVACAHLRSSLRAYGDDWFALQNIVWRDAPISVRIARAEADTSRRRRNFDSNTESFQWISRCVADVIATLPVGSALRVSTDDAFRTERALERLRTQEISMMSSATTVDLIEKWLRQ